MLKSFREHLKRCAVSDQYWFYIIKFKNKAKLKLLEMCILVLILKSVLLHVLGKGAFLQKETILSALK